MNTQTEAHEDAVKAQVMRELSEAWDEFMKLNTMKVAEFRIIFQGDVPKLTALLNKKPKQRVLNRM